MKHRLLFACLLAVAAPLAAQPGGPVAGATLQPDGDDSNQVAASVIKITELRRQGDATVKLFGTAGGDPAMNGLYTYLAFFESTAEGWRVFRVGDVLDYRVVSEARGRVVLELHESTMNEATGDIGSRRRRIALSWRMGPDGAPPASISVAAAR